ncbi:LOW QUALITY PROTEIN: pleckstrin homology domain-containing family A member 7-like [Anguilla anguilla]|uniref:LOW QUALITY PROTEIN: pleckstrin homology domain-containing family A member 7-like n=1 Tax=Anguilla anguilla TaxID=7936 RepID=UPI0015A82DA0|nr:LOW QUALITY PROTEIN: pleckstrin homology domain-containing family A member 7-like [Anguilla anguilla]
MAAPLGRDSLPVHWSYGVCSDGRVFFINDETQSTTWLHPRTGEPVNSGHMIRSDLPRGWEEGFTAEGASYFINHNQRVTAFQHPVTGQVSPENADFNLQEQPDSRMSQSQPEQRPSSLVSESSTAVTSSTVDSASGSKGSKSSGKVHGFGKRDQAIKRNPNVPVVVRGWLYKQDSSGMRLWKRKWFVLSDYCLFYYKDSREESVLGSIPLPSYVITPVEAEDHISRKYAFKACHAGMRAHINSRSSVIGSQAEHGGMRTYYFSADTQEDMNGWVRAMNQAALLQGPGPARESEKSDTSERSVELESSERQADPQTNHVNSCSPSPAQPDGPPELGLELSEEIGTEPREEEQREEEPREEEQYSLLRVSPEVPAEAQPPPGTGEPDAPSPDSAPPSRPPPPSPSRGTACPPEQNGTSRRGGAQRAEAERQVQRKTALAQVERWVKVQKGGDSRSLPSSEHVLLRPTPPPQPKSSRAEAYLSLPKMPLHPPGGGSPPTPRNLPSEYKYAQDRLSHMRMSVGERVASREGMVWQLYEWQQRQHYRHGSPTAPVFTAAAAAADPPSAFFRASLDVPRSLSVPPSPSDVPPSSAGPPSSKGASPRRPHTPADRVTVRPLDQTPPLEVPASASPRRLRTQISKTSLIERRSMPPVGYITHTVSAPSLHGKTPEELTLLLIQLRRHQARMANVRNDALAHLQQHNGPSGLRVQADDTYTQMKKDLEYLDLKVTGRETLRDRSAKPLKIAESDVDVELSRLCEQDKILQDLETRIRTLKEDKDKLESVLDVSHQQMEQYRDQPAHAEKIAYQQRLLQEDVVHIRAEISRVSTEMELAWDEYSRLEMDLVHLREALQDQLGRTVLSQQEKEQIRRELWRIEDVMAGLSSSKSHYQVTINSVKNPERKLVPSMSMSSVPSMSLSASVGETRPSTRSPHLSPAQPSPDTPSPQPLLQQQARVLQASALYQPEPQWVEDDAPPRPPLPQLYSPEEHPPAVPPLPKEASVIRHTSVRGLKRQSDERKRDREIGQGVNGDHRVELRSCISEPELWVLGGPTGPLNLGPQGPKGGYQTLPSRGLTGSTSILNQTDSIASYVTLRRTAPMSGLKERPKSALEQLYSGDVPAQRGRMSAEEQLERMKRHQKALVRERKRTLSQGELRPASRPAPGHAPGHAPRPHPADLGSWRREQAFDLQLLERAVPGEERQGERAEPGEERQGERAEQPRSQSDEWLTAQATPLKEAAMEPLDYTLDLSRELSIPEKVSIPERYVDETAEPLTQEEVEARQRKAQQIRSVLARSSVQNTPDGLYLSELDSAVEEKERIISISHTLASEASQLSRLVAEAEQESTPTSPAPPAHPAPQSPLSSGVHYTFV